MAPSALNDIKPGSGAYSTTKSKDEANYQRALAIIKEKLPLMGRLKALLTVNLGESRPEVIIDARGTEARLVGEINDEPDTRVTIKPEYIVQFYEGKLEPRYGLFKDAFFHEASLPKGNIPVAIKFGDVLCPVIPSPPKPVDGLKLPEATENIDQVKRDMKEFGYGLLKNALSSEQVAVLRKAVMEQAAGEDKAGVAARDGGPNAPNQRIWTLVNKGDEFLDLLDHPLIDEIVPEFLGDHALIHSYSANIARPGNVPMQLHTDQVAIQPPIRDIAFGLNIMWYLEGITAENGGTRVFPGSHLGAVAPEDLFSIDGTVAAEGPAGTALIFESRLWHATGPNVQEGSERPVILLFFMRSFIRQQENNFLSLRPEVEAKLSDRVKKFLGFCTTGALGGVEGEVREGIFMKKIDNAVGTLREPVPA